MTALPFPVRPMHLSPIPRDRGRRREGARDRNSGAPRPRGGSGLLPRHAEVDAVRRHVQALALRADLLRLMSEHLDTRTIQVGVQGAQVVLMGTVANPLDRQLAEDLTWCVPEVEHCVNRLRIG
ncbi:MAG: BON domain-containing protein [Nannocystaceae bacterium]